MARRQFTSPRERFKVVAENRTNKILNDLRILSHCANKTLYEYGSEEIDRIFQAIGDAVTEAKTKFKGKEKKLFKL